MQAQRAWKVDATNATVSANITQSMINFCGGFCADVASALSSFLVGQLTAPLQSQLKSALQDALCTKTNTALNPSCPTGSHDNGGTCFYDSAASTCVPTMLGMDGHVDLSGFLASLSPGTAGGLDFVLASGGNAIASTSVGVNTPDTSNAGAMPNNSPVPSATARLNTRTPGLILASWARGIVIAGIDWRIRMPICANAIPRAPLAPAINKLSVSSCAAIRARPAPSAARTAISC